MNDRNQSIIAAIKQYTEMLLSDPVKLAEWADKQRKQKDEYDAYMAMEKHDGDCYCHRCMSEFCEAV